MSERRRQPDYDFFAPPASKGASWGTPAGPASGSPGAAPSWGVPAQPSPFGTQAPAAAPSAGPTSWSGAASSTITSHPLGKPSVGVSSRVKKLIAGAVAALALVVGAGVAIPVLRSQHVKAQWRATTVAAPDSFEGQAAVPVPQIPGAVWYRLPGGKMLVAPLKYDHPRTSDELDKAVAASKRLSGGNAISLSPPKHADALLCTQGTGGFLCLVYSRSASLAISSPDTTRDPASTARELWSLTVHQR